MKKEEMAISIQELTIKTEGYSKDEETHCVSSNVVCNECICG
jgi:hypothetical protein